MVVTVRFLEWEKVHKPNRAQSGRKFAGNPPPNVPPNAYKDAPYTPSYTVHPRPKPEDGDEGHRDQTQRRTGRR